MKMQIGFIILSLGVMCADSRSLLIPTAMITAGAWLMYKGAGGYE